MPFDFDNLREKPACYPDLRGQVVVVTGGGSGIGRAVAIRLADEGMRVAVCGRRMERLEETVGLIAARGGTAYPHQADTGEPEQMEAFATAVEERFGPVDAIVHNAMQMRMKSLDDLTLDYWESAFATGSRGAFLLVKRLVPGMRERQRGNVVFMSSVGGLRAHLPGLPYDPVKGALDAMVRALAIEVAPQGVRVNGLAPGAIWAHRPLTEQTLPNDRVPLRRNGTPAEMAAVVAFLLSEQASYITGTIIYADGGTTAQLSLPGVWL
jgi:NAD(P)-dependent dehydrogenase (short-subunit alcohol dehydrogenase family)